MTNSLFLHRYHVIRKNSELLKSAKQKAHGIVLTLLGVNIDKEYLAKNVSKVFN